MKDSGRREYCPRAFISPHNVDYHLGALARNHATETRSREQYLQDRWLNWSRPVGIICFLVAVGRVEICRHNGVVVVGYNQILWSNVVQAFKFTHDLPVN